MIIIQWFKWRAFRLRSQFRVVRMQDGRYAVVCRDLWKNEEFNGASAYWTFDEDGALYITGYFGPDLMIIDNDIEEARQIINRSEPVLFDILPLSLEEVFIYELGGENDEIRKLVF